MTDDNDLKARELIIDCDPGCDDALAIILAIRSETKYKKIIITTVAGNVPVERTTHNAQKIASLSTYQLESHPKIEIYRGSSLSLAGLAPNVTSVHGRDGLGDVPTSLYPEGLKLIEVEKISAIDFFTGEDLASPEGKYDLVCTGPLTNIAMALSLAPDPGKLLAKFGKIVVMGGAFNQTGNITPSAEFNFFFDPLAVQVFLNAIKKYDEFSKIVFVPLEVTERVQLTFYDYMTGELELDKTSTKNDPIGNWTLCMLQKYFYFHAFHAKILVQQCALNRCDHNFLIGCDLSGKEESKKIREELEASRQSGSSGLKKLPRFCHLHDPLAVWYMLQGPEDNRFTESDYITVHTGSDSMRGCVIKHDKRYSFTSTEGFTKGIPVQYLAPKNIPRDFIIGFKKQLFKACGLVKQ